MPLPLALPIGLLMGLSLAWLARVELAHSEIPLVLTRPFLVSLGLGVLVYAPVVAYFVVMHGDWAYLYLVRFTRVPSALDLTFVALAAAQVPLGLSIASRWAVARRGQVLLTFGVILGVIVLVTCIATSPRLAVSASFAQYHAGFGVMPLAKTPLGRGVLLSWAALIAAFAWSAHVLKATRSS